MTELESAQHHVHIVGVGGAGMSAIATVLAEMGYEVSGSDLKASKVLDRLLALGMDVRVGHVAEQVDGADVLAISSAVDEDNVEVTEARHRGIPVLSRADVLSAICSRRRTIAVAGTHGKTSTSAMLSLVLGEAGYHPSFVIGGEVHASGTSARWDEDGEWMVVEADESDGTFLRLAPEIAVVTSLEPDHLEHYGGVDELERAFADYVSQATQALVSLDGPASARLVDEHAPSCATFGLSQHARFRVSDLDPSRSTVGFRLTDGTADLGRYEIAVPGAHNALNAAAAIAAGILAGADPDAARRALARFSGVARRFEFRGERDGVTFVDDYAHLPGEVSAVLRAARHGGYERVVAVFQPHRYSRTESLASEFRDSFVEAEVVIVTSVYAAGEEARPGVSGQLVVDAVIAAHPDADVSYVPERDELLGRLRAVLRPGDLCLLLEAGDLTELPDEMLLDGSW